MKKIIYSILLLIFPLYALIVIPLIRTAVLDDFKTSFGNESVFFIIKTLLFALVAVWLVISIYIHAVKRERVNKVIAVIGVAEPIVILALNFVNIIPSVRAAITTETSYLITLSAIILAYYILLLLINIKRDRPDEKSAA